MAYDRRLATKEAANEEARVAATFALRCGTSNVCVFPLLTRNKTAVVQFVVGMITSLTVGWLGSLYFLPSIPFLARIALCCLFLVPGMWCIIPIQGLFMLLITCGRWHDSKRGRLQLLFDSFDNFDCLAIQELFSGIFDTRYRNLVIREAKKHGLHYSVPCSRFPIFPAFFLNTGTMLLSRYPIVGSRTIVFQNAAFYDYFIVNRGASWMRLKLPCGKSVDYFTCHVAPPLAEVAERAGRIVDYCQCQQELQLDELITFMDECISQNRPDNSTPNVILAGDFNLDCGSVRYFRLLHSLQTRLKLNLVDLFAMDGEQAASPSKKSTVQLGSEVEYDEVSDSEDENDAAQQTTEMKTNPDHSHTITNRRYPSGSFSLTTTSSTTTTSSLPSTFAPFSSPPPPSLLPTWTHMNEWRHGHGNGKEPYEGVDSHRPYESIIQTKHLRWESTFGQILSAHPKRRHLETFLTHETLLGSHTTHDYFFTHCIAIQQRVEPFLTKKMQQELITSAAAATNGAASNSQLPTHPAPPPSTHTVKPDSSFTQLSDHSALLATLILPETTQQQQQGRTRPKAT